MLPSLASLTLRPKDTRVVFAYDDKEYWDKRFPKINDDTCAICLNKIEKNDSVAVLDCGHVFHEACIKRWVNTRQTCPVCIQPILINKDFKRIKKMTPEELFLEAVKDGDLANVTQMLEDGIDVNAHDENGKTALMWACLNEHAIVALALLERKDIEVNLMNKKDNTALHWASYSGMLAVVEKLIAKDADVNKQNKVGNTALLVACRKEHTDVALALLSHEDINVDLAAKDWAFKNKMTEVVDRIREIESRRASDDPSPMDVDVVSPNDRPKLTDDTFMKAINVASRNGWTHPEYGHISYWDVSQVTDMKSAFKDKDTFNEDIHLWNVSSVTDMTNMFQGAESFNQPLDWDVSSVTNMGGMFSNTGKFNQPLNWDVSNVDIMYAMFANARAFNQPLNWDVSSVTDMSVMFENAREFNQPLNWDVSSVTDMGWMFAYTDEFNQPLNWDVSSVTDMRAMFRGAYAFNQPLNWDVSSVTDMKYMFQGAHAFNQPLDWDVSSVTNMSKMFEDSAQDPLPEWYDGT